ncbi:FAD-dependent oxidoreductase domain-containing protein 1 [Xylocopa sonorina]|uniref:FAD-dependent oxidoreductase domain-containing protein 1 n=1 Tax=Xylocopa sonorina TaxID=1818115 RepID=UPI00403AF67E
MEMLRFLFKLKRQNGFLQKCTFLQTKRTFSKKNTPDKIIPGGRKSTIISKTINEIISTPTDVADRKLDDLYVDWMDRPQQITRNCDVVIIGGGAIGSSIAYWLRKRIFKEEFTVVVVERDPMYTTASTVLSCGGLRQQFSLQENIEMSLFGAEFIRNINGYLGIEGEPPIDVAFHPYGYLMLASEKEAEVLIQNSKLQNFLGAKNIILSPDKLKNMFPWLNTNGIEIGCLGLEKEGWFDPWALLSAFKKKAMVLGAEYITAEATGFLSKPQNVRRLDKLIVKTKDGEIGTIQFAFAIVAAGAFSADVAKMANIGVGDGLLKECLPVEPRKRYVYCFHCPGGPTINTPYIIDYNGMHVRREGLAETFICGKSPDPSEEPSTVDLTVDYDYFDEKVWPLLANRVPAFEKLKLKSSWAGYYEYNTFDQNGIIGPHPYYRNLLFATGFSGHGIQQSPAVGRAITELIADRQYVSIDLSKFEFQRLVSRMPAREVNII